MTIRGSRRPFTPANYHKRRGQDYRRSRLLGLACFPWRASVGAIVPGACRYSHCAEHCEDRCCSYCDEHCEDRYSHCAEQCADLAGTTEPREILAVDFPATIFHREQCAALDAAADDGFTPA